MAQQAIPGSILLTGGSGYIGSHTFVALVEAGHRPVILDDFSNSTPHVLDRLERLTGYRPPLERGSVLDADWMEEVLRRHRPAAVIHFAGDKAVGESVKNPLRYFHHNLQGAISLLRAMEGFYFGPDSPGAPTLVFSSSAAVYGNATAVPIKEDSPRRFTNPYGQTKLVIEEMLEALQLAQPAWRIAVLRYFNPAGAHPSGLIGENPNGTPTNLMPYITQVAIGRQQMLNIFGNDYPTPDGTCVRDYIHIQDLAQGHVSAVDSILANGRSFTANLGTGRGYSVLEVLTAFEEASGKRVPFQIVERRPGDIATCYADVEFAKRLLGWSATRSLLDMCRDAWRWQTSNPHGYE